MKKNIKQRKGSALAVVIIVGAAVTVLAAALLPLVTYMNNTSLRQSKKDIAQTVCLSSLEFAKQELYFDAQTEEFLSEFPENYQLYVAFDGTRYFRCTREEEYVAQTTIEPNENTQDGLLYTVTITACYNGQTQIFQTDCRFGDGGMMK